MQIKKLLYTGVILFPFLMGHKAKAQQGKERHRSVTINQTVVDGKVVSSDTIITYTDTTTRTVNSKEISMELPYSKGTTVHIDNQYRKVNIRQSKDNKVKLVTTTFYYGEPTFTNEQWLEKLNIKMQNTDSGISIVSGGINSNSRISTWSSNTSSYQVYTNDLAIPPTPPTPPTKNKEGVQGIIVEDNVRGLTQGQASRLSAITINGQPGANKSLTFRSNSINSTAVFDEKGNVSYNSSSLKRELTIYLPAGAKLDVASKYADVNIDYDLNSLNARITSATLEVPNVTNATISSTYGNISAGNIENGDISVSSGKLSMKSGTQLQLNTKYAKVEADKIGTLKLQSTSDDYDIDEVKSITGTKTYGKLRLDKLTGNFDLKGSSADVKIRNIETSVASITLDNKYADVQLPVTALKNYEVSFLGNYSSVFAPFERKDTTISATTKTGSQSDPVNIVTTGRDNVSLTYGSAIASTTSGKLLLNSPRRNGQSFTAAVGDTKGTHTIFKLVCNSCNVDFK